MKKIIIGSIIFLAYQISYAQSQIAACQNPRGYIYYPVFFPVTKDKSGWIEDKISGGKSILTLNAKGEYDIIFIDAVRNQPVSSKEDGGTVILLRKSLKEIAVLVAYDKVAEIYTYWKSDDGQLQYSILQSKGGTVSKSGAMVGSCQFINL